MKKKVISLVIFLITLNVYSFDKQILTREAVNEHWNDISFWEHGISSKLIEQGYNYAWESIRDKDLSTAWIEGVKGDGIGEWVIIPIKGNYQYLNYENNVLNNKLQILLKINNGFCKNERTFYNNNRVKKARITIYEVALRTGQHKTYALEEPCIMYETEILLEDSMNQQDFLFVCSPKAPFSEGHLYLYAQLTILDVYPGEKYQDTCISEMSATAEVIKETKRRKQIRRPVHTVPGRRIASILRGGYEPQPWRQGKEDRTHLRDDDGVLLGHARPAGRLQDIPKKLLRGSPRAPRFFN